jgi:phage terminase large subunit-like protein
MLQVHFHLKDLMSELQQTNLEKTLLAWCRQNTKVSDVPRAENKQVLNSNFVFFFIFELIGTYQFHACADDINLSRKKSPENCLNGTRA